MTGLSLGSRLGAQRRHRVAYLALVRRSSRYTMRAWLARLSALIVVAVTSMFGEHRGWALLLCLVCSLGTYLDWSSEHHMRRGTRPRFWLTRIHLVNLVDTDGRHRLSLGSYLDLPSALVLIAIPSYLCTDEPLLLRLGMLTAAIGFLVSTALLIFNDHTWFNPDEQRPPAWHEVSRRVAGPVTAALSCAVALPAHWGPEGHYAALVIALIPITVSFRVSDTDLIMADLAPLVQEESHAGRELVISEAHGALSTNLRLLEQHAHALRHVAPTLYELAVSANSRLRETLTLAHPDVASSAGLTNLGAPVFTLARAVGAKAEVSITLEHLGPDDRDLVRLVLSDLVGNALNAGAGAIQVTCGAAAGLISLAVTDDAPAMAPGVWKTPGTSSAWLEGRLLELSGSLTATTVSCPGSTTAEGGGKTVTARWMARGESA